MRKPGGGLPRCTSRPGTTSAVPPFVLLSRFTNWDLRCNQQRLSAAWQTGRAPGIAAQNIHFKFARFITVFLGMST